MQLRDSHQRANQARTRSRQLLLCPSFQVSGKFYRKRIILKNDIQSQSTNRPKLAEMLLERAAEEREHAGVLAKFQVERGANVKVCSFFF